MNSYSTGLHDFPTIHQWSDHDREYLAILNIDGNTAHQWCDDDAIALGDDGFWNPRKPVTIVEHALSLGLITMPTIREKIARLIDGTKWGFLKPNIQGPTVALIVETDQGAECLPDDVVSLPAFDSPSDDARLLRLIRPYVTGEPESVSASRNCFLCRLSAPGYMDCTDWQQCDTEADVLEWLEDQAAEVSDY